LVATVIAAPALSGETADRARSGANSVERWLREGWSVAAFAGALTNNNTSQILTEFDWVTDAGVGGVAVAKELHRITPSLGLEAEANVVHRFSGQDVLTLGGLLLGRWHNAMLADAIDTSLAAGYGVSAANRVPKAILREEGGTPKTMGVLVVEIEAGPPNPARISGFLRYQHRSSAFGIFGDEGQRDETTFISLGLRYRF
jgi:hypothetical protein